MVKSPIALLLLIGVAAFSAYTPIFSGWYTADDFWHLESFALPLSTAIKHIITGQIYLDHPDWHYRPLTNFVLMFVCRSHSPFAGHVLCVLIHAATAIVLYRLLKQMGRSSLSALAGSLFFALLPAAAPAVCWISSVGDLMAAFFAVWTAVLYLKTTPIWPRIAWIGILFTLALLSKEMAVTLPFLLLFLSITRKKLRNDGQTLILLFSLLTIFIIVHTVMVGSPKSTPVAEGFTKVSSKTLVNAARYFSQMFVPVPTHLQIMHPLWVLTALPLALLMVQGALHRKLKTTALWFFGGITAIFISLAPVINAFSFWYCYLPSIVFAVVMTGALPRSFKPANAVVVGAMLIMCGGNVFQIALECQHAGTYEKNLLAKIAHVPGDTLNFGNFPRIVSNATLLANGPQLCAGLAFCYGIRNRTLYVYAPRWYEHIATSVRLEEETARDFTLTIPMGCFDYFSPYLFGGPDSKSTNVTFSDFTSFSGRPRRERINFSREVKLLHALPVYIRKTEG